jgi:hypothetical protein
MFRAAPYVFASALLASADDAWAHGLGQRYDLPLPLWFYLFGAACAVVASFAFLTLFRQSEHKPQSAGFKWRMRIPGWGTATLRVVSVTLFLMVVAAGLVGNPAPLKNITPMFVWVIWWVGFAFLCAFVVNLWPLLNPFATLFEWADRLSLTLRGRSIVLGWCYPEKIGAWPAFLLFLMFSWVELIAPGRDLPRAIAIGALIYAGLTWIGCVLFGPRVWVRRGEAFSVFFSLLGRFAPIHIARGKRRWACRFRPFAVGLMTRAPLSPSLTAFALLMLATVTVDGLLETPLWAIAIESLTAAPMSPLARPSPPHWPPTALLCAVPALFAVTYLLTMTCMTRLVPKSPSVTYLAGRFVLTLIPIATAYHLAHYLSFLLLAGQLAIPLASDPFGTGWDLFGTKLYRMNIGIVDARTVWFVAVGAIVIGHILATWLAHEAALEIFADARAARLSQIPMLVLMVSYTVLSLWILAQPIVDSGS